MRAVLFLASVLAFAAAASCSPDAPPTGGDTILVVVTPPTPRVQAGFTIQLSATVNGPPGISQEVDWESRTEEVVTVTNTGLVEGISAGEGIIRVRWAADNLEFTDVAVVVTTTPIEEGRAAGRTTAR